MMSRADVAGAAEGRSWLENHFLLKLLDEEDRKRIVGFAKPRRYAAGQTIFLKGDEGNGMMAVLKGQVRISAPSREGKEVVLNIINPGEVFGEIALLDGRERTADATALNDCELLVLERRDVMQFLHKSPEICIKLLVVLCDKLRRTTEQVEDVLFLGLASRLAKILLRLTEKEGEVKIAQRELGNLVGVTRESVNKYLADWQRHGMVEVDAGVIRVCDREALELVAEGE
jgi:CRP/FNR family transcriptional regulator, cyclic AMP receptor protein